MPKVDFTAYQKPQTVKQKKLAYCSPFVVLMGGKMSEEMETMKPGHLQAEIRVMNVSGLSFRL